MQILELSSISDFKCDGQKCNSKCCKKWRIDIDEKTFSKYKHIKPAAKSKEITKHIKKQNSPIWGEKNLVTLAKDRSCPFLGEDKLCFIQKNYGESYLSMTCRTYPRLYFKISDDLIFRTLTLTCPLAAKLLLNIPRNSTFHTFDTPLQDNINYIDMTENDKCFMMPLINITNHNILRFQGLSLDERLAVIDLFAESANNAKNLEELANISETFEKEVLPNAKNLFAPLKFNSRAFIKEMLNFIKKLFTEEGAKEETQIYTKFINETFEISVLEDENFDYDKLEKIFTEKYLPAKKELFEINNLQIENYAINYLFMTGLPVRSDLKHFSAAISKYILEYKMAEFMFVCFYSAIKENWHKIAIELIAEDVANCFEHNLPIRKAIEERFKNTKEVMPMIQLLLEV